MNHWQRFCTVDSTGYVTRRVSCDWQASVMTVTYSHIGDDEIIHSFQVEGMENVAWYLTLWLRDESIVPGWDGKHTS
jgi:hypothetical protein